MRNPLSPFIMNLFMNRFEIDISKELQYFPRVWLRYVDDVFAIFDTKKSNIEDFIMYLNQKFPSIRFTFEKENKEQLPFLEVLDKKQ